MSSMQAKPYLQNVWVFVSCSDVKSACLFILTVLNPNVCVSVQQSCQGIGLVEGVLYSATSSLPCLFVSFFHLVYLCIFF